MAAADGSADSSSADLGRYGADFEDDNQKANPGADDSAFPDRGGNSGGLLVLRRTLLVAGVRQHGAIRVSWRQNIV